MVGDRRAYSADARWSFAIFVARSIASLVFVIATSRALGSAAFGPLAALSAATSIGAVLATSGVSHAATMFASRSDDGAGRIMAAGLRSGGIAAAFVAVAFLAVFTLIDAVSLFAATALFVADVVVGGASDVVASCLVGLRRFRAAAAVWVTYAVGRAFAGVLVVAANDVDLDRAVALALACSLLSVPVVVRGARSVARRPGPAMSVGQITMSGRVFLVGNLVGRVNNDFDKLYLPIRLGAVSSVGTYAVGYRIVEYALLPLTSLSAAAYPRMFRAGESGTAMARRLAHRLRAVYLGTAAGITLALFLGRGFLEWMFGPTFGDLSHVITLLLGFPVLRAISNLLGEPLTGSGQHHRRVAVMGVAAIANVGLNVALIGTLGWQAAVWSTYGSELVQIALLAMIAWAARGHSSAVADATAAERRVTA